MTATLFAAFAFAQNQPPSAPADGPGAPPTPRGERFLQRFDTNHDGKLDDAERAAARAEWDQRRAERGGRGRDFAGQPGWRPEGPDGFGPGGFDGPPHPRMKHQLRHLRAMMHRRMMAKFDHDHDGRLNDAEYAEAQKFRAEARAKMKEHRQMVLERFDSNHDGRISGDEGKAMRDAWNEFLKSRPVLPAPAATPPAK